MTQAGDNANDVAKLRLLLLRPVGIHPVTTTDVTELRPLGGYSNDSWSRHVAPPPQMIPQ